MSKHEYPIAVVQVMRLRRGLEPNDPTLDSEIAAMHPRSVMAELVGWDLGHPGWFYTFETWIESVGGKIVWPGEELTVLQSEIWQEIKTEAKRERGGDVVDYLTSLHSSYIAVDYE